MITVAIVFAIAGRCTAPDPAPLPAKTQARLERHTIETRVDSVEIRRLLRERDRAEAEVQEQLSISVQAGAAAMWSKKTADSLRAIAEIATSATDSARAWHAAYDARTLEADSLESANAQLNAAITTSQREAAVIDSISHVWAGHAARSDTLILELLPLAQRGDRCRILGLVKCPSRKQTAIAAAVATIAVMSGRIRIRP